MPYQKLGDRLADASFPLVLCGPMLRRVTQTSVTVFVALRQERSLTLEVYNLAAGGGAGAGVLSGTLDTVQLGDNLHVAAVTAATGGPLVPGTTYVYNLFITPTGGGATQDLMDAGVVAPDPLTALTYRGKVSTAPSLPSFVAAPSDPKDLRFVHVSCRKPHGPGKDALPVVDTMIETALKGSDPLPRPHLLIHTGDQIYADDVADELLHVLIDAGDALLGWNPGEIVPVPDWPARPRTLRPGTRQEVIKKGGLTSDHAPSHLLGYAEYVAMYLHAWSPTVWPSVMPTADEVYAGQTPGERQAGEKRRGKQHDTLIDGFHKTLTDVRRLLANVPSLMQFDDHEVTDDWYRNLHWLIGSQDPATPAGKFGRTVIRNGLAAYAVFQLWGNTPERFNTTAASTTGAEILQRLGVWHQDRGAADTAAKTTLRDLERFLGLPEPATFVSTGAPAGPVTHATRIDYHFSHEWQNHQVLFLDTRTMRVTPPGKDANHPPMLISGATAYGKQFAGTRKPVQGELVIVVSPAPVFGAALHEFPGHVAASQEAVDPEHWPLSEEALQELLARLVGRMDPDATGVRRSRIVILSGDVHYASTVAVQYSGDAPIIPSPRRVDAAIAQLTSSAAKNQAGMTKAISLLSYGADLNPRYGVIGALNTDKIYGWANPSGGPLLVRAGVVPWNVKGSPGSVRRSSLLLVNQTAVMVPTPAPEWIVDIDPAIDTRAAGTGRRAASISSGGGASPSGILDHAVKALRNVPDQFGNRKIIGNNNVGDITFRWGVGDAKSVVHRLWFRLADKDVTIQPYTEHVVDLRVGEPTATAGQNLRIGDHDRDAGGLARYDGADRVEPVPGSGLVRLLQNQLRELGFVLVGTADGTFAESTEEAVREFQIYAAMSRTARVPGDVSGPIDDQLSVVIPAEHRYLGAVTGVVDAATRAALTAWADGGWRCPVVAREMQGTVVGTDNVWRYDEVTNPASRVVIRDLSGMWTHPTDRAADGFHRAGRFVAGANNGPVALAPEDVWAQAELLPTAVDPAETVQSLSLIRRSTFKVVRAVSERECMGYLDSVSTSDSAVLEAGAYHWTFGLPAGLVKAPGELAGFAAFFEFFDATAFDATFTRFGLRPLRRWRQLDGLATGRPLLTPERTYVTWWARPHDLNNPIEDSSVASNRFRSWHWFHRFQMAARTMPAWRRAMYVMARIRIRDILSTPWGKKTGTDGVPDIAGQPATIGDVISSERGVALLTRWHVFRPSDIVNANASGPALRAALTAAGRPAGAPSTWSDAFEAAFLQALMANPPPAIGSLDSVVRWPRWIGANPLNYSLAVDDFLTTPAIVPPGFTLPTDISTANGLLSAIRGSFHPSSADLPDPPDYTKPGFS